MNKGRSLFFFLLLMIASCDQRTEPFKAATYYTYQVLPSSTDEELQSTVLHAANVDTRLTLREKLFIFLGGTGSTPQQYTSINKAAASLGYHVINVSYLNTIDGQACKDSTNPNCFASYHDEIIFGGTQSDLVNVNVTNSIRNRILKLLQRLHWLNPNVGWNQFYDGAELEYTKFVLAGHSQGGGHAAYMAQKFAVDRVVLFSSPNDYSDANETSAAWCKNEFETPIEKFYAVAHKRDEALIISKQYSVWKDMKMLMATDTGSADGASYSDFNAVITNFNPNSKAKELPLLHNLTARDYALPTGDSLTHLKQVWIHLMGNQQ